MWVDDDRFTPTLTPPAASPSCEQTHEFQFAVAPKPPATAYASVTMKLKRFLLRYYPPGIILVRQTPAAATLVVWPSCWSLLSVSPCAVWSAGV